MIEITIRADYDKIISLKRMVSGSPSWLEENIFYIMQYVAEKIYNDLWNDESIPRHWRESLKIAVDEPKEIIIGPVWSVALLKEKGTETGWKLYRCPKQRYWGGVLKKGEEGKDYLLRYWNQHREEIIGLIKKEVEHTIRRMLGI